MRKRLFFIIHKDGSIKFNVSCFLDDTDAGDYDFVSVVSSFDKFQKICDLYKINLLEIGENHYAIRLKGTDSKYEELKVDLSLLTEGDLILYEMALKDRGLTDDGEGLDEDSNGCLV